MGVLLVVLLVVGLCVTVIGCGMCMPLLKVSTATGVAAGVWDSKFHDNNVSLMASGTSIGLDLISDSASKMVPAPMKIPTDIYFSTIDRLSAEAFYHVGKE